MSYVVDRQRVWRGGEIVAVFSHRRRGVKSQILLSDGSTAKTLTHPSTLARMLRHPHIGLTQLDTGILRRYHSSSHNINILILQFYDG